MTLDQDNIPSAVKLYQQLTAGPEGLDSQDRFLAKFSVHLPDRPGSLAGFATTIAQSDGNISFFHYDRSLDGSRVAIEVQLASRDRLASLLASLKEKQYEFENTRPAKDDVQVTSIEGLLELKVRLENKPGSLAAFARLLAGRDANVIYMLYDEAIDAGSADIALATRGPQEIDALLQDVNEREYHYRVVYRGSDAQEAANIIGLKIVEKFFLRLKKLLPASDLAEIKSLVDSSKDLHQDLVQFATEAGNDLEAGDVFETVLTFASRSRSMIGDKFSAIAMPVLRFPGGLALRGFRLPTSENFYLFEDRGDLTLIDAGHGIYFQDIKKLIRQQGLDPSRVKRIFVTHPDTDHVGGAGYFEQEFGAAVFLHAESADVVRNMNRAHGAAGRLLNLNKYYTRLSIRFTECRFPSHPTYFTSRDLGTAGRFRIIDRFLVGALSFDVLESLGGHTPGLVFFLNREFGLLFTSDFLLNVPSLTASDKEHLNLYRYLLTSPNRDSRIYKEETTALKDLMASLGHDLRSQSRTAYVFPGHGEYYSLLL